MSNDRNHAAAGDGKQVLLYLGRDAEVAERHQQILRFADGVTPRMGERVLNVVVGKMQVTAQAEGEFALRGVAELTQHFGVAVTVVSELVVAMGRRHDVRDAVEDGHTTHLRGQLPGLRTIVNAGKDVAVDVNHVSVQTLNRLLKAAAKQVPRLRPPRRTPLGMTKT